MGQTKLFINVTLCRSMNLQRFCFQIYCSKKKWLYTTSYLNTFKFIKLLSKCQRTLVLVAGLFKLPTFILSLHPRAAMFRLP